MTSARPTSTSRRPSSRRPSRLSAPPRSTSTGPPFAQLSATSRPRPVVDNKNQLLAPGISGRVQLFGGEYDALLVPDTAIISDQSRKIVFAVGEDNVVKAKPVTLGPLVDGLRVVRDGLAPTDQGVLAGLATPMARPGA